MKSTLGKLRRRRAVAGIAAGALVACATTVATSAEDRPVPPRIYALTHATVVAAPGERIDDGTVVLRDGLIDAVGAGLAAPPDAVEIDLAGKWVYAGFVDAGPVLEVRFDAADGPGGSLEGEPAQGAAHPLARVRPERRASDRVRAFDDDDRRQRARRLREQGFAIVTAVPSTGVFRGQGATVALVDDRPVHEILVDDRRGQHVAFERGRFGRGYPTSLMGVAAAVRQTLHDAARHVVWTSRYAEDPTGLARPDGAAAWSALEPVLAGLVPIVFHATSTEDVLLADRLAREFDVDAWIVAEGALWERADEVAATARTVVLPAALPERPDTDEDEVDDVTLRALRRFVEAPSGPARLHDAGVRFAWTSAGLDNPADFLANVRKAVGAGLDPDVALAAVTVVPAELLGLERAAGRIAPGRMAHVVVADGPLFEDDDAVVEQVFVDGVRYESKRAELPAGDPDAVVDPRGTWSVVYDFGPRTIVRTWTIAGSAGALSGTAETREGIVDFEKVELAGNVLTVRQPSPQGSGTITVVIAGERFEGTAAFGARAIEVRATRTSGPEEGAR